MSFALLFGNKFWRRDVSDMQKIVQSLEQQLLSQKNRFEAYESEIQKLRLDLEVTFSFINGVS